MDAKPHRRISIRIVITALIALQLLTIVALAATTLRSSEDVLRAEIGEAIERDAATTAERIDAILDPATDMAHVINELVETSIIEPTSDTALIALFITELEEEDSALASGMFVGRADGSFLFVNRDDTHSSGGYRVKSITTEPTRSVAMVWRDATGTVFASTTDPADAYDPRTRSWYQLAVRATGPVWTDPYVFFTARTPGVTAALELNGGSHAVVGIDIELSSLGSVLAGVGSTPNATAFLLDGQGRVLALPGEAALTMDPADPDRLTFASVDEIGDPTIREAMTRVRKGTSAPLGRRVWTSFSADGADHQAVFTPLEDLGWTLGVTVPDSDYTDPLNRARTSSILLAGAIGVASLLLGIGISRSVVGPMQRLRGQALFSLAGEGTGSPPVSSRIREINDAATALREVQADLENKVHIRTAELENEIETRKKAELDAESASRAKSEFLANVSHELRTPLSSIIGLTDIMLESAPGDITPQEQHAFITDINVAGTHLLDLIKGLLDLSRIEAGELDLHRENTDVTEAVNLAAAMVSTRAEENNVKIRLDVHDLPISADPLCFKQIVINLLSNAVKFTPPGGEVAVTTLVSPAGIRLSVTDTGIGMSSQEAAEARTMFGQVENALVARTAGTGLGLTLVERLVEAHGWRWDIESEPGAGTTVWVLIPRSDVVTD